MSCLKWIHPVKKTHTPNQCFCYCCFNFLDEADVEAVLLHVFYCCQHPFRHNEVTLSALNWGQIRYHCSVYQKIQDHLDEKSRYPFPSKSSDVSVQTELICDPIVIKPVEHVMEAVFEVKSEIELQIESEIETQTKSEIES